MLLLSILLTINCQLDNSPVVDSLSQPNTCSFNLKHVSHILVSEWSPLSQVMVSFGQTLVSWSAYGDSALSEPIRLEQFMESNNSSLDYTMCVLKLYIK